MLGIAIDACLFFASAQLAPLSVTVITCPDLAAAPVQFEKPPSVTVGDAGKPNADGKVHVRVLPAASAPVLLVVKVDVQVVVAPAASDVAEKASKVSAAAAST